MCHDGASATGRNSIEQVSHSSHVAANQQNMAAELRRTIAFFMQTGYNVGLINSVEWMDTKVKI